MIEPTQYEVLTNLECSPDILLVGTAGALDLVLFEYSNQRAHRYSQLTSQAPPIIQYGQDQYIQIARRWGGAAHYCVQELASATSTARVALWTVVGEKTDITKLISDLDALGFKYYLVILKGIRRPIYPGIVFSSGQRYWSHDYLVRGAAEYLIPNLLPSFLQKGKLCLLCTQPMRRLLGFLEELEYQVVVQLFEDYLPDLYSDPVLKDAIWNSIRTKCVLLNLNEVELWQLGRLYYRLDVMKIGDLSQRARLTDDLVDQLARDLQNTLLLISFGSLGALIACRTEQGLNKFLVPSLPEKGVFGIGAGDTALAGAIRTISQITVESKFDLAQLSSVYSSWGRDAYIKVLKAFVISGLKGCCSIDPFTVTIPASLEADLRLWQQKVGNLPIMNSFNDLLRYHKNSLSDTQKWWGGHDVVLGHVRIEDLENLIWEAYSPNLSKETSLL